MSAEETKLIEVRRVWGLTEADIIKAFLESNGIDCVSKAATFHRLSLRRTDWARFDHG